jgi:hypothetical protein
MVNRSEEATGKPNQQRNGYRESIYHPQEGVPKVQEADEAVAQE